MQIARLPFEKGRIDRRAEQNHRLFLRSQEADQQQRNRSRQPHERSCQREKEKTPGPDPRVGRFPEGNRGNASQEGKSQEESPQHCNVILS